MKIFVTKVFLNDIIGIKDLSTSDIIKQMKIAIASDNKEPEMYSGI